MNKRQAGNRRRGRPVADADLDTRERLLDAATALFAEQGIEATTMAEIAARVGVTPAMVHYYFKTRDQLIDAVAEERIGPFIARVGEMITGNDDDPFSVVQALVSKIIHTAELMPWLPPVWIREIANEGGQLRERMLQRIPVDKQTQLGMCLAEGQRRGVVNPYINPYLLFVSIIGLTLFPLAVEAIWKRFPTLQELNNEGLVNHATSLLLFGLTGPGRCVTEKNDDTSGGCYADDLFSP